MSTLNSKEANTLSAIGNTPLARLQKVVPSDCVAIYVKLAYLNPTGPYKDRMARAITEGAEQRGALMSPC